MIRFCLFLSKVLFRDVACGSDPFDSSLLSFCFTFGNIIYFVEEFVIDGLLP